MASLDNNIISHEIDSLQVSKAYICSPEKCVDILKDSAISVNILHLNIRSVNCNFDRLLVLLTAIKVSCDVIILSESWLSKAPDIPQIAGYNSFFTRRNYIQNDGVVIYIKCSLESSFTEPPFTDGNCLVCKIGLDLAIVAIYRSPSYKNVDNFITSLDSVLWTLRSFNSVCIMGDINIDISPNIATRNSAQYLDLMAFHGLLPGHQFPTRGNSCLDHIILKSSLQSTCLAIDSYITDHMPTLLSLLTKKCNNNTQVLYKKKINYELAKLTIDNTDFSPISLVANANEAAEFLVKTVSGIVAKCTVLVNIPRKRRILKPWITPGLLRCIRNRDRMHIKQKNSPLNATLKLTYTRYRNFCNNLLKKLKREFERNELQKARKNIKATWDCIKKITNTSRLPSSPNELLHTAADPKKSLNLVNGFFANVGKALALNFVDDVAGLPLSDNQLTSVSLHGPHSMALFDVDEDEVNSLIGNLKDDCASGWDDIPTKILKLCRSKLVPPITYLLNLCFASGVFPNFFKRAMVHPIFKNGDRGSVNNYRPISVLPSLSKVLEKALNNRLVSFLNKYNILATNQYGFRRGISTEDAVLALTNEIVSHLDNKIKCVGIFLDLSKAFDTVSVPLLIDKLQEVGVRGSALEIFGSYLTDRTQCVTINSVVSDLEHLTFGVPQGSILGPTLFLIYINELCNLSIPKCNIYTYADDTALVINGRDWLEVHKNAEFAMKTIMAWLCNNKLTLNIEKSHFLPFAKRANYLPPVEDFVIRAHSCSSPTLVCSCMLLKRQNNVKYLGVTINETLSWFPHLTNLTSRIRKLIYIFKKLRNCADFPTLKLVYFSLCQSITSYCICVWGGCPKTSIINTERAQRAVLKVMISKPIGYPTSNLLADTRVLSVRKLFILHAILRKHVSTNQNTKFINSKRKGTNLLKSITHKSTLAERHYNVISTHIYNNCHKKLNIYKLSKQKCKNIITKWLMDLTYEETENILGPLPK